MNAQREYQALAERLPGLTALLDALDLFTIRDGVSRWAVAHHLHHLALAHGRIFERLGTIAAAEGPGTATSRPFNASWTLVKTLGWIPRGVGRAPRVAQPPPDFDADELRAVWARKCAAFEALAPHLDALAHRPDRFAHPVFGQLDPTDWLRFTHIHTRHHHKIIQDIRAAA